MITINKIKFILIAFMLFSFSNQVLDAQCTTPVTPSNINVQDLGGGQVSLSWDLDCNTRTECGANESLFWYVGFYGQNSPSQNGILGEYAVANVLTCDAPAGDVVGAPITSGGDDLGVGCLDQKGSTCLSQELGQNIGGDNHTWNVGGMCGFEGAQNFVFDLCPGQCYDVYMWELVVNVPTDYGCNTAGSNCGIELAIACGEIGLIAESPVSDVFQICLAGTQDPIDIPELTILTAELSNGSGDPAICATAGDVFIGDFQLQPATAGSDAGTCSTQDTDNESVTDQDGIVNDGADGTQVAGGDGGDTDITFVGGGGNSGNSQLQLGTNVVEINCRDVLEVGFNTPVGCDGIVDVSAPGGSTVFGVPPCPGVEPNYTNAIVYISNNGIPVNPNATNTAYPTCVVGGAGGTNTCDGNGSNTNGSAYPANWSAQFGPFLDVDNDCFFNLAGNPFAGGGNPLDFDGVTQQDFGDGVLRDVSTICVRYEDPCDGSKSATCVKFISDSSPLSADIRSCPVTCTDGTGTSNDGQIIVENVAGGSADGNQDTADDAGAATSIANYFVEIVSGPSTGALTQQANGDWVITGLAAGLYTIEVRDELATGDSFAADTDDGSATCGAACPIELVVEVLGPPINTLVAAPGTLPSCADAQEYTTDLSATQIATASNGEVVFNGGPGSFPGVFAGAYPSGGNVDPAANIAVSGLFAGCASDNMGVATVAEICVDNISDAIDITGVVVEVVTPSGNAVTLGSGTGFTTNDPQLTGNNVSACFTVPQTGSFVGDSANGTWSISIDDGFGGATTIDGWSITFNDLVCTTTTGITDFAACGAAMAGTAPADAPTGVLTWVPNANGTDMPAVGDLAFADASQTMATFTDPAQDQTANTYCYTVTGFLPGSNFTADGLDLSCTNMECCAVETEVCFSTQPCFECGDVPEPKVLEYWLCEGASLPTDEGLKAICPDCDPNPEPFCPFDPNTMDIEICISGIHTWVSDMSFYAQSPNGVVIFLAPYANSGTAGGLGNCNLGDDFNNLCFTNTAVGNDFNVCALSTPLTGTFDTYYGGQAINWAAFTGQNVYDGGWNIIVGDCVGGDVGALQDVVVTISDNGGGMSCLTEPACVGCDGTEELAGPNNANAVVYASGPVSFDLNDGECEIGIDDPAVFPFPIPPFQTPFPATVEWYDAMTGGNMVGTGNTFQPTDMAAGDYTYYAECVCDGYNTEGDCAVDEICRSPRTAVVFHIYPQDAGATTADNQILCCGETVNFDNTTAIYDETLAGGTSAKHDYELGYAITAGSHTDGTAQVMSQSDLDALPAAQVFMADGPNDTSTETASYTTSCTACPGGTTGTLTAGVYAITPFTSVDELQVCNAIQNATLGADISGFSTLESYQFLIPTEGSLNNLAVNASGGTITLTVDTLYGATDIDGCFTTQGFFIDLGVNGAYVATANGGAPIATPAAFPFTITFPYTDFGTFTSNDALTVQITPQVSSPIGVTCPSATIISDCLFYASAYVCSELNYDPTFDDVGEGAMCAEFGEPVDFVVLDPICATEVSSCNPDGTYSIDLTIEGGLAALDGDTYVDGAGATVTIDGGYQVTVTGAISVNGTAGATGIVSAEALAGSEIEVIMPTSVLSYTIDIANYDENGSAVLQSAASTTGCPIQLTGSQALPDAPTTTPGEVCLEDAPGTIMASCTTGTVNWYQEDAANIGNPDLVTGVIGTGNSYMPADAASGTYTYFATCVDADGCESAPTPVTYLIDPCATIEITDPCICLNDQTDNTSATGDGTFGETITVTAAPGLSLDINGGAGTMGVLNPDAAWTENPAGVYVLNFEHLDGAGYIFYVIDSAGDPVVDSNGDQLVVSNNCIYPEIQSPFLSDTEFCADEAAEALSGSGTEINGFSGDYTYTIDGGAAVTGIDPTALTPGPHTLNVTFSGDFVNDLWDGTNSAFPGCETTLDVPFVVNPLPDASFTCPSSVPQCDGNFALAPVDGTGTWSGSGASFINGANEFEPLGAPVGLELTLIYTVTDANGCTDVAECSFMVTNDCGANGGAFGN